MRMLKHIFCIAIAFVLCCTGFVMAADERQNTVSDELTSRMEVLRLLGFITDYYDYNTLFSGEVSRADFVRCAAKLVNADEMADDTMFYYDVPKSHYAFKSISALTKMGVINGTENRKFEPERPIEVGAAYKIILSLMGYGRRAYVDGGYPAGYMKAAKTLDIYNGESFDGNITRGSMLNMIYNAMKTKIYSITEIGDNGSVKYEESKDDTLLSLYHDVYYDKGIVYGADMTTLDGTALNKNEAKIGDTVYLADIDLFDTLGEEAEFFYRKKNGQDEGTIIWARSTGAADVIEIDENSDAKFDKNRFELSYCDDNGRSRKISLDRSITVIYNGDEVGENVDDIFALPFVNIKLVRIKGKYSAAILEKATTIVVGGISATNKMVYDKAVRSSGIDFDEAKYDYFSIQDASGNSLTFDNLSSGMVLSIFKSLDNKRLKVIVASDKITGTVERIDNGTVIYIGGNAYTAAETSAARIPNLGDNVILYLDYKGDVAYTEGAAENNLAVYVYKHRIDNTGLDETLRLKMLTQDGKILQLECAEKVICDGERKSSAADIAAVFYDSREDKNSNFKPQLALIKLNSEDKVCEIDTAYLNTAYETSANTLTTNMPKGSYTYKWTGFFGGQGIINSDTIIFCVPGEADIESAEDKAFRIKNMSDLTDGKAYMVSGFKAKERTGYEQFLVMNNVRSEWNTEELPFLVSGKVTTVDEDGSVVEALRGYNTEAERTLQGADTVSFDELKRGMLIRLKCDDFNKIEEYQILFDPYTELDADGRIKAEYQTTYQFDDIYGIVKGHINDVVDGVIKFGHADGGAADQFANKQSAPVLICELDNERNPITAGGFEDADTYYNCGDECSKVVMQSYCGTPKFFVIYK